MDTENHPPLAAVFIVVFDQKVGYEIVWRRTFSSQLSLDGVEYRSLPSGLHSVKNDLVYFLHEDRKSTKYAGISAFVQQESDTQHRNANFISVGALVPLAYGRLAQAWVYTCALRKLASELVQRPEDRSGLDKFWSEHKVSDVAPLASSSITPPGSSRKRERARSDITAGLSDVGNDHPALSVPALLDTCGPLIFPLHRAALLRKRILLLSHPPVQKTCDMVYNLSTLANIPSSLQDAIRPLDDTVFKIHALFSVGIHDIPSLSSDNFANGYLACTTDDILREKRDIYDLVVQMAPTESRRCPAILTSDDLPVRATQRDLRRYRLLLTELSRVRLERRRFEDESESADEGEEDQTPLMRSTTLLRPGAAEEPDSSNAVEPVTWTAMAYNGFMWWASAGEAAAWENEETLADQALLEGLPDLEIVQFNPALQHTDGSSNNASATTDGQLKHHHRSQAAALLMTAYFRHLTTQILQTLTDLIEDADDGTPTGLAEEAIRVNAEDMRAMGLDSWSEADKDFVKNAVSLYFDREAVISEDGARICGVRIC